MALRSRRRDAGWNIHGDWVALRRLLQGFAALLPLVGGLGVGPVGADAPGEPAAGAAVYQKYCAGCHDQVSPRIPARASLQQMSATQILRTLDSGLMMSIAYPLRRDERDAVARYLGREAPDAPLPARAFCGRRRPSPPGPSPGWNGWSPGVANTRFQPADQAGLTAASVRRLRLKWAFGFRGDVAAFAAPTVVNGVLYVGSASGVVHALDARSGCLIWTYQAGSGVRGAPVIHEDGSRSLLLVGDLAGTFYALDALDGRLVWKRRVEEHEATRLTGAAAVLDGLVFVPAAAWEESRALAPDYPCCTFRGSVTALRIADGSVAWKTYLVEPATRTNPSGEAIARYGPSGVPIWSAPTIDAARRRLYVATGDNYSQPASSLSDAVVAIDADSGRVLWSQQVTPGDVWNAGCITHGLNCPGTAGPDFDFGAAPVLTRVGDRDILVAGQKSAMVYGLDPADEGRILWRVRVGKGGAAGGVQWGLATDGTRVYAAVADAVRVQGSNVGATPIGDAAFDPVLGGGLTALELATGARAWFAASHPCVPARPGCSPAQPGAVTAIPGVVFSGSLDGHLRAFSTESGAELWDVDTARRYETVDGVAGKGGSLDGPGPVVVGGMLYVNSGYPRFGGMPGNVLLAFSIDGR